MLDKKEITYPTESTETKVGITGDIPKPQNVIEKAINVLRKDNARNNDRTSS